MGCPCDSYACEPEKKAILVLNDKTPILIDQNGMIYQKYLFPLMDIIG